MTDCIFCKIANKEIPSEVVYEDAYCVAFMDISPTRPGHVLVAPKEHSEHLLALAPVSNRHLWDSVQAVAVLVKRATACDGLNVSTNVGEAAGQVVKHTHVHIIPRMDGDGLPPWPHAKVTPDEIKALAQQIRQGNPLGKGGRH